MAGNKNLSAAKAAKKDEFYTQLTDIENELRHYREHFRDKTVLCNCDDPYESNFFKYFALNFNTLGLKKLICTCYDGSPVAQTELSFMDILFPEGEQPQERDRKAYLLELTEVKDVNGDGAEDLRDVELILKQNPPTLLQGNGDFRSAECVALLQQADIVVTNPPFSLFREYVAQLMEYEKKFLIIGPVNAITYKEVFPLIKENKIWLGYGFNAGNAFFHIPDVSRDFAAGVYDEATGLVKFRNCHWFTNLDHQKRHEPLDLYKTYSPEEYPHYDNYDAIEVSKTSEIPEDYDGVMGVPITFLDKYCPEQFEILGMSATAETMDIPVQLGSSFIENYRKQGGTGHFSANMYGVCYYDTKGKAKVPYGRILIRKRK